ncbi:hypothetical protein GALL_513270 [mine drainage metagenome]|uniref:Uncharacterized protein n=1 Tax=mine drainage metagenome TaxID=410659 RepID=A0A1J5P6B6_9ZZZZ
MDARLQEAEAAVVKVAADAGKQIFLIGGVDQHLQTLTHRRAPPAHDRLMTAQMAREFARVPGNLDTVVAHEVAGIQRRPQRLVRLKGLGMQRQFYQGITLALLNFGVGIGGVTPQGS